MQTYLGLGSNLGDRLANMQKAVEELKKLGAAYATSSVFECDPMYNAEMPKFLNAIVVIDTELGPRQLLEKIKEIEKKIGRKDVESGKTAAREIDIDILFYGAEMVEEGGLVIPHPRMLERLFVLMPLEELNPEIEMNGKWVGALVKKLKKAQPGYSIVKTKFQLKY